MRAAYIFVMVEEKEGGEHCGRTAAMASCLRNCPGHTRRCKGGKMGMHKTHSRNFNPPSNTPEADWNVMMMMNYNRK
jgi:hypothetical protein